MSQPTKIKLSQVPAVRAAILTRRQDGKCAICLVPIAAVGSTGCLDHDHYTGVIRGVLCRNCNGIEGKLKNLVVRGKRGMTMQDYLGQVLRYWILHSTDKTGLIYPSHLTDDEKRIKRNTKARKIRAKKKQELTT